MGKSDVCKYSRYQTAAVVKLWTQTVKDAYCSKKKNGLHVPNGTKKKKVLMRTVLFGNILI